MSLPLVIYISTRQVTDALGVFPPSHFKPTTVNDKTIVCIHFYLCTLALYLHLIVASLYVQHIKHNYKKFKFFLLTSSHNAEVKTIGANNAFFLCTSVVMTNKIKYPGLVHFDLNNLGTRIRVSVKIWKIM